MSVDNEILFIQNNSVNLYTEWNIQSSSWTEL